VLSQLQSGGGFKDQRDLTRDDPTYCERICPDTAALALRGQASINWPEGSFTSYAIYCLNALVEVSTFRRVLYQESVQYNDMPRLVEDEIGKKGKAKPALDLVERTNSLMARS